MILVKQAHLLTAVFTHPGMSGKHNEDRFHVSAYQREATGTEPVVFAVVADGVGGKLAGEVAADTAVTQISAAIASSDGSQPVEALRKAIAKSDEAIKLQRETNSQYEGMGTTVACALVIADKLYTATVGNSRVYLMRGKTLSQISVDHTWVQKAIDHGALTVEQAQKHPHRSVITRYLGSTKNATPDFRLRLHPRETDEHAQTNQGLPLQPEDIIMLCSDGLTDLVADAEIAQELQGQSLQQAVENMTALACERGGHDNITTVALKVPLQEKTPETTPANPWWWGSVACSGIIVALFILTLLAFGVSTLLLR